MTDQPSGEDDVLDPPGGHDPEALEEADERMNVDRAEHEAVLDPPGGHDAKALKDAAEKFKTEH